MLSAFEGDLQFLAATPLHPALRAEDGDSPSHSAASSSAAAGAAPRLAASASGSGSGSGHGCLLDLVAVERLREAAAACARGHQHFGTKVRRASGR